MMIHLLVCRATRYKLSRLAFIPFLCLVTVLVAPETPQASRQQCGSPVPLVGVIHPLNIPTNCRLADTINRNTLPDRELE